MNPQLDTVCSNRVSLQQLRYNKQVGLIVGPITTMQLQCEARSSKAAIHYFILPTCQMVQMAQMVHIYLTEGSLKQEGV